jgi:predicted metal-dependent hydrolase
MSVTDADKDQFKARVRGWAEKLDARVTSISVRPMTTKWASYSTTGRLTFDASLLELRRELQDYVIAHELLHFHAPNHGKLWKSLMRAHLGEYERLEGELRRVAQNKAMQRGSRSRVPHLAPDAPDKHDGPDAT